MFLKTYGYVELTICAFIYGLSHYERGVGFELLLVLGLKSSLMYCKGGVAVKNKKPTDVGFIQGTA